MVGGVSRLPYMMPEDIKIEEPRSQKNGNFDVSSPTKISLIQLQNTDSIEIKSQKVRGFCRSI